MLNKLIEEYHLQANMYMLIIFNSDEAKDKKADLNSFIININYK